MKDYSSIKKKTQALRTCNTFYFCSLGLGWYNIKKIPW